jgi:hypothetical protein
MTHLQRKHRNRRDRKPRTTLTLAPVMPSQWLIACATCDIDGDTFTDISEAIHLVSVHNELHHAGSLRAHIEPYEPPEASYGLGTRWSTRTKGDR